MSTEPQTLGTFRRFLTVEDAIAGKNPLFPPPDFPITRPAWVNTGYEDAPFEEVFWPHDLYTRPLP